MRNLRVGKMLAGKGIVMETTCTCSQGVTIVDKVASGTAGREHHWKPVFSNLHTCCGIRTDILEARTKGAVHPIFIFLRFSFYGYFVFLQVLFQN